MERSGKYFSKVIFASVAREHQRLRDLWRKAADQTQPIQYWKTFATSCNRCWVIVHSVRTVQFSSASQVWRVKRCFGLEAALEVGQ